MADSAASRLAVEVVYALADQQVVVQLLLPAGATVADAVRESGLVERFPEIAASDAGVGIYGRRVEPMTPLRTGDRVELYRRLSANPKEMRRRRARASR